MSKENLKNHLDLEHQQINPNDENIVEIILLKSSAKMYLIEPVDSKSQIKLINDDCHSDDDCHIGITTVAVPTTSDDEDDNVCIDLTLSDED